MKITSCGQGSLQQNKTPYAQAAYPAEKAPCSFFSVSGQECPWMNVPPSPVTFFSSSKLFISLCPCSCAEFINPITTHKLEYKKTLVRVTGRVGVRTDQTKNVLTPVLTLRGPRVKKDQVFVGSRWVIF